MPFDPTGPDVAGQLAAMNASGRRLFERGQVVAVNGNDADIRVGYDARGEAMLLRQVPICSGYAPRVGDWVAISYEAGHSGAPWVTGPSMAADATSDSAGVGVFSVSAAAPSDPQTSTVYFDTAAGTWRGWDGSAWRDFASDLHNHLGGIQGGATSEYFHLNQVEHDALQDFYDGSAMAAGYLKRLSFRAIDASGTQRTTVFEKDGDCYWAVNAVYDADTGTWSRVDASKYAYLMGIYSKNGIPHEPGGLGGIAWWRCAPGANPIGDYTAVGGWELGYMMTMHRNYVMGGMGLELDGSGSPPYGRLSQSGHEDPDNFTALLRNAWYEGNTGGAGDGSWGLDDASHPCWFTGFVDSDGFVLKYRASAAGPFQTRDWIKTLTVTGDGDLWLKRNLDVDGTATIGALSGYVKGSSGTLSAVAQVPWSDLSGVPSTFAPSAHGLVSASHTAAGLTAGQVLRATGATSFAWAAIQDADLPASLMRDSEHASDSHTMTIDGVDVSAFKTAYEAHDHSASDPTKVDYSNLLNIPATFAPASHAHGVHTGLDYASAGHTGFEPTVTKGNLSEASSAVLTITGGAGAVIGSGTAIQVKLASGSQSGYLSSGDWTTFNSKQAAGNYITALTGDVTASGPGSAAATIANGAVTYAKMQDVSATDRILGRATAGSGDVEEIMCTAAGRAILDDASVGAIRTTLGVGTGDNPTFAGLTLDGAFARGANAITGSGDLGASGVYVGNAYVTRHYVNPTAYLDGSTSGAIGTTALINMTGAGGAAGKVTINMGNSGWAVPSAAGADSNGDKVVFYNAGSEKYALGLEAGHLWISGNAIKFYSTATAIAEIDSTALFPVTTSIDLGWSGQYWDNTFTNRLYLNSTTYLDGPTVSIVTDTTTGLKIGTATNQKLGFFNATPVVQQAHVADPAATVASLVNAVSAILSRLETLGLFASA